MASAQHEALTSAGRSQRRRITELGRQNNALRSQVARQNETLNAVPPPRLDVLDNVPWMIWTVAPMAVRVYQSLLPQGDRPVADYCTAPPRCGRSHRVICRHFFLLSIRIIETAQQPVWDGVESGRGWAYEVPIRHAMEPITGM